MPKLKMKPNFLIPVLVILVSAYIGVLGYQRNNLIKANRAFKNELAGTKEELASTTLHLNANIATLSDANYNLQQELDAETNRVQTLAEQVSSISGSVNTLTKLSQTDPELLKKYSKVYFLNENYIPKKLVQIDPKYTYDQKKDEEALDGVHFFLLQLLNDASAAGVDIKIISSYRSFGAQASLKNAYKVTYGTGANSFSSDQGYSEHQLGTAVDFTNAKVAATFSASAFEKSQTYQWLTDNAYKYGFVLSYPKNNAYYIFEPWHWRYVGHALALKLQNEHKYFYDLDQRTIDQYLVSFFD